MILLKFRKRNREARKLKILLGLDGSENSLRAVRHAAFILQNFPDSTCTLVFINSPTGKKRLKKTPEIFEEVENNEIREGLEKAQEILNEKGLLYTTKVLDGHDVAETICNYAKEKNFDQIILGTRGLSNLKGIVMGSVSHKVLQLAPCPVTFVR